MAITEAQEEQAAAFRARKRQDRVIPWLIRVSDGTIYPNVPLIARKPNFRPYTGDLKASLEERMAYVEGLPGRRKIVFEAAEPEPFNIKLATKEELIAFAMEEYSEPIDENAHLSKVRAAVCRVAGLDYNVVFGNGTKSGRAEPAPVEPQLGA